MSEQLVLDLPYRPALGADDFLVSSCNAAAVDLIDAWPEWPHHIHLIEGPSGCGKSHLANVWRHKSGAQIVDVLQLSARKVAELDFEGGVILEDLDRTAFDEQSLFHLLNLSRERGFCILVTARVPPGRWSVQLPDLISRLRALPVSTIGGPDDALLSAVLLKHFSDRQLNVEPQVLKFMTTRMVRSMEAAHDLAAAIDHAALSTGRKITRQFAGEILERLQRDEERP